MSHLPIKYEDILIFQVYLHSLKISPFFLYYFINKIKILFFLLILIDLAAAAICNITPDLPQVNQAPALIDFFNNFLYNNNI